MIYSMPNILAVMRTDRDETLCGAACGPEPFWCSCKSAMQMVEICALMVISENRLMPLSCYLSGSRGRFMGVSDPYFSFSRNKMHIDGFEEAKLLTRNTLIYEEENTLVFQIFVCLV